MWTSVAITYYYELYLNDVPARCKLYIKATPAYIIYYGSSLWHLSAGIQWVYQKRIFNESQEGIEEV